MLIKSTSLAAGFRVPHELGKKNPDGTYNVKHPVGCECSLLYSVNHAKWVTYNAMDGWIACDHCGARQRLPLPAVREGTQSRRVLMDLRAIEDDLFYFQTRHENCPAPLPEQPPSSTLASPQP